MIQHNTKGLTQSQVEESRQKSGSNVITPQKDNSAWKLLCEKFEDPIIRVLLVAATLSMIIAVIEGKFTEPIGIISAILLATGVGFIFDWDAMRRFRRLNKVNDDVPVKVMRDGEICTISRHEVVVGDLIIIESGEMIPADGELIEAVSLHINESSLTGELEVEKTTNPEFFDSDATYPSNIVMRGTSVTEGYGRMVVTAVGDSTEAGKVTEQSTVQSGEQTPLNKQLTRLSGLIGKVGISLSVVIFGVMLAQSWLSGELLSQGWLHAMSEILHIFMISVAIIVMSVPEGLPMSITLSLAMSMRRMLRTNNLVRRMHACETMGAVTVICTDKTGTLTQNKMRVHHVDTYGGGTIEELALSIAANSTAYISSSDEPIGNPTEGALLLWLKAQGFNYSELRDSVQIIDRLTFSTERKYMATIIKGQNSEKSILCVKGAPEIVRGLCQGDSFDQDVAQSLLKYQNQAMRTLGVAWCYTTLSDCEQAIAQNSLQFAAIAAITDPIREDVPGAVAQCLKAGVTIKVVTGDTPATAREISRQVGLWDDSVDGERNHLSGTEFAAMSDEELLERIDDLKILSRARPLDKQRLVQLLQRKGEVVAVTGDGTNDAPALNFANVGLSMGSGTSVAKDASDITLLDDSFSSIATAIMWGRSLYRNIQRFVLFQLTINFAALVTCFVAAVAGMELPLTVVQILWVNIIMDTFAAMAMASLPPNPSVMLDKPRKRDAFIITPAMTRTILACGLTVIVTLLAMMFIWTAGGKAMTLQEQTLFFSVFVFFQFWNMFNAKGFETRRSVFATWKGCREFVLILIGIAIGQIVIVCVGGEVFRVEPLGIKHWAQVIGYTSVLAIGGEIIRTITRKIQNR